MNFFEEATLRLKQQLGATQDKEVALALGLSPQSWVGRKKRDNFPEVELYALAAKRPDLKINVEYVLTGLAPQPMTAQGRDDYLMGKLAALELMVQSLLETHPHALEARDRFLQKIKGMEAALAQEAVPQDLARGLREVEREFRLLPLDAAATVPEPSKAKRSKAA